MKVRKSKTARIVLPVPKGRVLEIVSVEIPDTDQCLFQVSYDTGKKRYVNETVATVTDVEVAVLEKGDLDQLLN